MPIKTGLTKRLCSSSPRLFSRYFTLFAIIINPAIIIVILNPSHVILSAAKNLVVMLRTGSVKDLVTA